MAENDVLLDGKKLVQEPEKGNDNQDVPPKTYTQEELDALLKDAEAKGYGKGKFDTNAKWEKTSKERERIAKEEAEKQARFEKMSELEKAQTQAKESMAELQALKDELALNAQKEETRKLMEEQALPTKDCFLRAVLVPKDAEATKIAITEFKTEFEAELQKRLETKIKPHIPQQNIVQDDNGFSLAQAKQALKLK